MQFHISISLIHLKNDLYKRYNLVDYHDINAPLLIFGCYKSEDLQLAKKHKGKIYLIWGGSDIMNINMLRQIHNLKNVTHISQSKFISDDLNKFKIPHISIPFVSLDDTCDLTVKQNYIYIYYIADNPNFFGINTVLKLEKMFPKINFIYASQKLAIERSKRNGTFFAKVKNYSKQQLQDIYSKCFLSLRLTKHDGISTSVQELGLRGVPTIHNGTSPACLNYKSFEQIVKIIKNEYGKIGTTDETLAINVRKYLNSGIHMIKYLENPLIIDGDNYLLSYNSEFVQENGQFKITNLNNKWLRSKDDKIYNKIDVYDFPSQNENDWINDNSVGLIVITYDRYDKLINLLDEIEKNNIFSKNLTVYIYDDCSKLKQTYNEDDYNFCIKYHKFKKNHGKQYWFILHNFIMNEMKYNTHKYYYYFNDDMSIIGHDFFSNSIKLYESINDPKKITLNLHNDRGPVNIWTGAKVKQYNDDLYITQWTDLACFMTTNRFFEILNYNLSGFVMNKDPKKSSGVGSYISKYFFNKGYNLYLSNNSFVIHEGNMDSKMNPVVRKNQHLISQNLVQY